MNKLKHFRYNVIATSSYIELLLHLNSHRHENPHKSQVYAPLQLLICDVTPLAATQFSQRVSVSLSASWSRCGTAATITTTTAGPTPTRPACLWACHVLHSHSPVSAEIPSARSQTAITWSALGEPRVNRENAEQPDRSAVCYETAVR